MAQAEEKSRGPSEPREEEQIQENTDLEELADEKTDSESRKEEGGPLELEESGAVSYTHLTLPTKA